MVTSKVMRLEDYEELKEEALFVEGVVTACGGWQPEQHQHRHWEYYLLEKVYCQWLCNYPPLVNDTFSADARLKVADVGGCIGLPTPMMLSHSCDVVMYEPWVHGDWSAKFWHQVSTFKNNTGNRNEVTLKNTPLCEMKEEDKFEYDIALCVSTLEHIGEWKKAWFDLLTMVKPNGLVFITSDFAEHEEDNYQYAYLRAGRMFIENIYEELIQVGTSCGFTLLDGKDYAWSEECRLVNDYGFASLAMVRTHAPRTHLS